ncbi:hypothetical protein [Rhodopirellula halodulae]|uniref:hypothetical protein n=1 Tax=Rhodopirellula halodulae TaxID=2894198 RepID=UPI001E63BA49|nr:hypothetical protein [Rhodopirellula sp. JC737]
MLDSLIFQPDSRGGPRQATSAASDNSSRLNAIAAKSRPPIEGASEGRTAHLPGR